MGFVDAHGRWADHGARRRRRPAHPAAPRARPGGRARGARRGRRRRALRRVGRRAARRRCARAARRQAPTCRWVGAPPTGSSRACPCGSRSGRRDLADGVGHAGAPHHQSATGEERKSPVALDARRRRGRRRARPPAGRAARRGDRAARVAHRRRHHARRRARGRGHRVGAHPVGHRRAPRARPSSRRAACRCDASRRADGSLPESDDEPGLVAIVARSY